MPVEVSGIIRVSLEEKVSNLVIIQLDEGDVESGVKLQLTLRFKDIVEHSCDEALILAERVFPRMHLHALAHFASIDQLRHASDDTRIRTVPDCATRVQEVALHGVGLARVSRPIDDDVAAFPFEESITKLLACAFEDLSLVDFLIKDVLKVVRLVAISKEGARWHSQVRLFPCLVRLDDLFAGGFFLYFFLQEWPDSCENLDEHCLIFRCASFSHG